MIHEFANIADHVQFSIMGALAIGSSLLKGVGGLLQSNRANKMLKSLKDPGYNIPKQFGQNVAVSEQLARQGMPSEQYNLASQNIQRGTQAGLRQLGRMSNPFAGIAGLSRAQSDAFAGLDAQNAAVRRQNIMQAMGARREMAGQELAKQQFAQQRYMENINQANAMRGAGLQNMFGAIGDLASIGMQMPGKSAQSASSQTFGDKMGLSEISKSPMAGLPSTASSRGFYDTLSRGNQIQNVSTPKGGFYDTLSR